MMFEYAHLLPDDFHPLSKVWIYQSNRSFSVVEALHLEKMLNDFTSNWQRHNKPIKSYSTLLFGQFVLLMADETVSKVGGCGTDASTRFIKQTEEVFGVNLFDRTTLAFVVKDKVELLPFSQLSYAVENKFINSETLYFNNLITTKQELINSWITPVKNSWIAEKIDNCNIESVHTVTKN